MLHISQWGIVCTSVSSMHQVIFIETTELSERRKYDKSTFAGEHRDSHSSYVIKMYGKLHVVTMVWKKQYVRVYNIYIYIYI